MNISFEKQVILISVVFLNFLLVQKLRFGIYEIAKNGFWSNIDKIGINTKKGKNQLHKIVIITLKSQKKKENYFGNVFFP